MTGGIAKRYARALSGAALESNRLEETAAEFDSVDAWLADADLAAALESPVIGHAQRSAILAQMTQSLALSDLTRNFLNLLADRKRLPFLGAIAKAYRDIVDRQLGRLRAVVRVASPLPDQKLAEVIAVLERITGKKILPKVEIEPGLIAGLSVEVEGRVYDGSVRTQIEHLARALARDDATS